MKLLLTLAAVVASAHAYWLMGIEDFITTERMDPVVSPGKVSGHVHSVLGGSNFRLTTNTSYLRESECTSIPIPQDKSAYWFPHLYFQWNNGSFTSLTGGAVIYYLFSDTPGTTTAFPDDFRMLSGDPTLRTYNASSFAQQAITFLCLDFNGVSTKFNQLPAQECPDGIRAQINFPSCWDGKNTDSSDHKSHVSFLSTGPDSGSCSDPKFPVVLPRIFMEVYWASNNFDSMRSQAMNTSQPFVFSYGDPTGYGYHADFINGWDAGVLQKAVNECHCNEYGDATCCAQQGIFDLNQGQNCYITNAIDEQTTGTLLRLPGNNPVQPFGHTATTFTDDVIPPLIEPIYAYTGQTPTATGSDVVPGQTIAGGTTAATTPATTPVSKPVSSPASSPASAPVSSPTATSHASAPTTSPVTTHPATSHTIPNGIPSISIPSISIPSISIPSISIPSISLPLGIPLAASSSAAAAGATPTAAPASAPGSGSGSGAAPASGSPAPAAAGAGAPASQPSILAAAPANAGSPAPANAGSPAPANAGSPASANAGSPAPANAGSPPPASYGGSSSGSSGSASSSSGSSSSSSGSSGTLSSSSSSNNNSGSAPKCRQRRSTTAAKRSMEKHRRRSAFAHHHDFTN